MIKRSLFVTIFVSAHVLFIIAQIHKYTLITKLSYQKQKSEEIKVALEKEKQELKRQLSLQTDPSKIKQFAKDILHLRPITINQVKKISYDDKNI